MQRGAGAPDEPRLVQALRAHRGEVTCVEAAGARLATAADDRALLLWRWRRGAGWELAARAERAHRYGVSALRWAASGVLLASGGLDGGVRVWGGTAGSQLVGVRALGAGTAAVRALCWAGRARLLAGHDDGALRVWAVSAAGAALLARLAAHDGALYAVAAPAQHALLLTACTAGVLKVFDLAEVIRSGAGCGGGAAPAPLTWVDGAHDLGALCVDAAPGGALVATGGHDALVRLWHAERRGVRPGATLAGHGAAVTALRWAAAAVAGGALLATVSLDRTARLWSAAPPAPAPACLHVLHAHARYLTCVTLEPSAAYMLTGSNDKTVRMWSLGSLSLDDELEPACVALEHFALGDLEGIEPVMETSDELAEARAEAESESSDAEAEAEGSGVRRVWLARLPQHGPINGLAAHQDWLATASSDGCVRVYWWSEHAQELQERQVLRAHYYPATSVDVGAGGALLLSAGLDARACLWDLQSGVQLRVLSTEAVGAAGAEGEAGGEAGSEAGGGGVRCARLSSHRPPRVLLATDDGLAPVWTIDGADTNPACVYGGHADGAACCAWARDGTLAATGAAGGELRVLAPPRAAPLSVLRAHGDGVQSCDFAPECEELELAPHSYLLATGGGDSMLRLWVVDVRRGGAELRAARAVEAHGGGVASVRWGGAALLVTAGADGWARVWRAAAGGEALTAVWGARAGGAGGVLAAALLPRATPAPAPPLLACGTLAGELSVWRPPPPGEHAAPPDDEATAPALWGARDVRRWLAEYVVAPAAHGAATAAAAARARGRSSQAAALLRAARAHALTGARLLHEPLDELLQLFGADTTTEELREGSSEELREGSSGQPEEGSCSELEVEERAAAAALRARLREELLWLRTAPPTDLSLVSQAPHSLLCPLTHELMREPARAADGYTYERANLLDWLLAAGAESAVSPVSGRRLRSHRVEHNEALRHTLRAFLRDHGHAPAL